MSTTPTVHENELTAAELTLAILGAFHRRNFPYSYLRNYEELPARIGNDVDLLVAPGQRNHAFSIIRETIRGSGWTIFQRIEFGPISLYLCSADCRRFLHIDLFDRIEWHWISFADTRELIKNKRWNGIVYHPETCDEVYLNVMTRLGYAGVVREKHQYQASACAKRLGECALVKTWMRHLGKEAGMQCGGMVARGDWKGLHSYAQESFPRLRLSLMLRSPISSFVGLFRYCRRSVCRTLRPPGPVIVWEGGESARRKTAVAAITLMLQEMTGREDITIINLKSAIGITGWFTVWRRWLFQVVPSSIKNRAVLLLREPPSPSGIWRHLLPGADACLDPYGCFADVGEECDRSGEDENFIEAAKQHIVSRVCRNSI